MSASDFLNHIRSSSLFAPRADEETSEPPEVRFARAKKYAHLWLVPESVAGFEPESLWQLSGSDRTRLTGLVNEFRRLASQYSRSPQDVGVIREGWERFTAIRGVIRPLLYDDQTWAAVHCVTALRSEPWFPEWVIGQEVELGIDHTGDPAAWVRFVVPDEFAEDEARFVAEFLAFDQRIGAALRPRLPDRLVYTHVRTVSEELSVLQGVSE